jgi:hypothetical protein
MSGAITPFPNMSSWRGAQLKKKHRDNFTFTLPLRHILLAVTLLTSPRSENTNIKQRSIRGSELLTILR